MDPEPRAFLEAMEQRLVERMATKNDVEALGAEVRAGDEESRRHMDVLYENTRHELGLVIDHVNSLGEHIERSDEERKSEYRAIMHVLQQSITRHSERLDNHEERITALEQRSK